jgi:hypothetical protein
MGNYDETFIFVSLHDILRKGTYSKLVYFAWFVYTLSLGLIKVSLCIFYLEIFPMPRIRMVCYIILTWIILNTLVVCALVIFSCIPVQAFWNRDLHGKCLDISALAFAISASAIAQDVVLLVFPLCCIRKLNMKRYRKVAVGFMFCVGTLYVSLFFELYMSNLRSGCITTLVRLHALLSFKTTIDPTWDFVPSTVWTELELASGFACSSLPAIRMLLVRITPKGFLSSITSKIRSSHNRSTPTPGLDVDNARRPDRKRLSWMHISTNNYESTVNETQNKNSRLWPGFSSQSRSRSQSHQRLGSLIGNEKYNMSHLRTGTAPVHPELGSYEYDQVLELVGVSKARQQHICYSCGHETEIITALPESEYLSDESFSGEKLAQGEVRWWKNARK